jgi:mono/diheme cytochrome c family protein
LYVGRERLVEGEAVTDGILEMMKFLRQCEAVSTASCWRAGFFLGGMAALLLFFGCDAERRKSDAELNLNPQQSAGRRVYDRYCDQCHEPYSSHGKKGPGLKGVFKKEYLPESGLPANDDRVGEIIRVGRSKMPAYGQTLDQQQIQDLLVYLHTL